MIQVLAKTPLEILFEQISEHELIYDSCAKHWKAVELCLESHLFYSIQIYLHLIFIKKKYNILIYSYSILMI